MYNLYGAYLEYNVNFSILTILNPLLHLCHHAQLLPIFTNNNFIVMKSCALYMELLTS